MDFKLPFDVDAITGMAGKTMVLAENHRNENLFHVVRELKLDAASECGKTWWFEADRGALVLLRDGSAFCEFSGMESRGGTVYAVGYMSRAEAKHGFHRVVMYEKTTVGDDVEVCVSSHVGFEEKTLDPLLKSLRKTGFDMAKVKVVVDGDSKWHGWSDDRDDEVTVMHRNADAMGFAGLMGVSDEHAYALLVHDTCAFEAGFPEKLAQVDVGLHPDIVLLAPPSERIEMGLYSREFVHTMGVDIKRTHPTKLMEAVLLRARVVTVLGGKTEFLGEKDVYGSGAKRRVIRMESIGLRKFQGKNFRGGKP